MNETTVLTASIAVLSIILVVVGVYSVLVLRDFRTTVRKVNKILGNTESASEMVMNGLKPAGSLASVLVVLKDALQIIHEMKELTRETRQTVQAVSHEAQSVAHTAGTELRSVTQEVGNEVKEITEPAPVSHDISRPKITVEAEDPPHRFFKRH